MFRKLLFKLLLIWKNARHTKHRERERIRRKKNKSYFSCFVKKSVFFSFPGKFFHFKNKEENVERKRTCFIWRIFLQLVHDCRFGKSR